MINYWTDRDRHAIRALRKCTFLPGSYNKRFVFNLSQMAANDSPMTNNQLVNLWRLIYSYRHQHKDQALMDIAMMMRAIGGLFEIMRGKQEIPDSGFVEHAPMWREVQQKADLEKLARWNAG